MMSLLPEALNRFFAAFRATRDRIPSARLQNDNPPDLSTLQITQRVPQAAQSMLSLDSGYRSDRPVSPTLHRAPGSVGDQFIDLGDSTRPFGVGPAANTPERASSEFGNLPSSEQFQTTTGGIEAAGPYLLSSSDIDLLSGDNAFLGDELSFPPGPWPMNPDYMSLDSERDWNGNFD